MLYNIFFMWFSMGVDNMGKMKDKKYIFKYEYFEFQTDLRKIIRNCEGEHTQQVVFSTFHDALTQICFNCKKIRSTLKYDN